MNTQSAEQRVFALARKMLPGAANLTITGDMDLLTDLNADSLSLVSLIFAIEEEFGLEINRAGRPGDRKPDHRRPGGGGRTPRLISQG